jgi:hypothetical protein
MEGNLSLKLNVGGEIFTTSLATLRNHPNSMLGAMFSGNHNTPQSADGTYFIDRDATHFRHILNFMRDPNTPLLELTSKEEEELMREAKFFCLYDEMFPINLEYFYMGTENEDEPPAHVNQDQFGIFYASHPRATDSIITICDTCKAGYIPCGPDGTIMPVVIPNFANIVKTRVYANQPRISFAAGCVACKCRWDHH